MKTVNTFPYKMRMELLEKCLKMQISASILHKMSENIGGQKTEELCEEKAKQLLAKIRDSKDKTEVTKIIIRFLEED